MQEETLQLIITSIIAPGVLYMGKALFDLYVQSKSKKCTKTIDAIDVPSLQHHAFFDRMRYLENHIRYCFSIPNKGKELIFKDILFHYVEIYVHHLSQFVTQDVSSLGSIELSNMMSKCLDSATIDFNSFYKNSSDVYDEFL